MKTGQRVIVLFIFLISVISISNDVSSIELPIKNVVRNFFEKNNVSLSPVYGVIKGKDDHVATVHGFVDNLEICNEFITLLNKDGLRNTNLFSCVKLNDGALK